MPEVDGSELNGSFGSGCQLVPLSGGDEILLANGVVGSFVNHHLRINNPNQSPGWTVYIRGPGSIDMAMFKTYPSGGRFIVQGKCA